MVFFGGLVITSGLDGWNLDLISGVNRWKQEHRSLLFVGLCGYQTILKMYSPQQK